MRTLNCCCNFWRLLCCVGKHSYLLLVFGWCSNVAMAIYSKADPGSAPYTQAKTLKARKDELSSMESRKDENLAKLKEEKAKLQAAAKDAQAKSDELRQKEALTNDTKSTMGKVSKEFFLACFVLMFFCSDLVYATIVAASLLSRQRSTVGGGVRALLSHDIATLALHLSSENYW